MAEPALTLRRWKRVEYERLVELGVFEGDPIELIGGQLVVAEPHGTYHASVIGAIDRALQLALPPGWIVRCQLPVALDDESEPEPDLAVVSGTHADYRTSHPSRPALLLEVAESSLHFDRHHKGGLYARGGVQDYWIVNLIDRVLEVYRDPSTEPTPPHSWRYRSVERLERPAAVTLLALPSIRIAIADLLP